MKKLVIKFILVATVVGFPHLHAAITSQSKDIVVLKSEELPELAQSAGQSMQLHNLTDGRTYLYVEQQQLRRLVILDISAPSAVRAVGSTKLDTAVAFDFVRDLGDSAALVCFRDNRGAAVIDFRKPKEPTLSPASALLQAAHTEEIGQTGFLMINEARGEGEMAAHDYQVVDSTDPHNPKLLTTVAGVQKKITDQQTGAIYLLGSAGLTIVRRPEVEQKHNFDSSGTN